MDRDLVVRVSRGTVLASAPVAVVGFAVGGGAGALGVLAGALLAMVSFWSVARSVQGAAMLVTGSRPRPVWALGLLLRYLAAFGAAAILLRTGIDPVGLLAGLAVLPPVLVVVGLRLARVGA